MLVVWNELHGSIYTTEIGKHYQSGCLHQPKVQLFNIYELTTWQDSSNKNIQDQMIETFPCGPVGGSRKRRFTEWGFWRERVDTYPLSTLRLTLISFMPVSSTKPEPYVTWVLSAAMWVRPEPLYFILSSKGNLWLDSIIPPFRNSSWGMYLMVYVQGWSLLCCYHRGKLKPNILQSDGIHSLEH
jgi:hypothetical protein